MRLLQNFLKMMPCWPSLFVWRMDPNAIVSNGFLLIYRWDARNDYCNWLKFLMSCINNLIWIHWWHINNNRFSIAVLFLCWLKLLAERWFQGTSGVYLRVALLSSTMYWSIPRRLSTTTLFLWTAISARWSPRMENRCSHRCVLVCLVFCPNKSGTTLQLQPM